MAISWGSYGSRPSGIGYDDPAYLQHMQNVGASQGAADDSAAEMARLMQQLGFSREQAAQALLEGREQRAQEQAQFNARLGQEGSQFNARLGQEGSQFNARLGLDQQALGLEQQQYADKFARQNAIMQMLGINTPANQQAQSLGMAMGQMVEPGGGMGMGQMVEPGGGMGMGTMDGQPPDDYPMAEHMGLGSTMDSLLGTAPSQGFSDMLSEQRGYYDQLLSDVEGFGDSQRVRINQGFDTASNNALANLERRGLGASSLAGGTMAQVEGERAMALGDFEDQLLGRRLDLGSQRASAIGGIQQGEQDRQLQRRQQGSQILGGLTGSLFG